MSYIFETFLYQPLLNILILIYQYVSFRDFGVAIIILTILIRFVLAPFLQISLKQQMAIGKLQPEIKKIQQEYKNDKERQSRELLNLYSKNKINPFSGLILIIQIPILIALYRVFLGGLNGGGIDSGIEFYSFVTPPEMINYYFLGLINLREKSLVLALGAAIVQYFQSKLQFTWRALPSINEKRKNEAAGQKINQTMVLIGPILTFVVLWNGNLPAAIALYWLMSTLFSFGQQLIIHQTELKKCRK